MPLLFNELDVLYNCLTVGMNYENVMGCISTRLDNSTISFQCVHKKPYRSSPSIKEIYCIAFKMLAFVGITTIIIDAGVASAINISVSVMVGFVSHFVPVAEFKSQTFVSEHKSMLKN